MISVFGTLSTFFCAVVGVFFGCFGWGWDVSVVFLVFKVVLGFVGGVHVYPGRGFGVSMN